jgi:nicotinamide-nucleotide amidase
LAEAARKDAGTTYGLATTGIAGPTGGSTEKPVGTVFVGLATPNESAVKRLLFPSDRETFKQLVAQTAFELLRRNLVGT